MWVSASECEYYSLLAVRSTCDARRVWSTACGAVRNQAIIQADAILIIRRADQCSFAQDKAIVGKVVASKTRGENYV